MEENSVLAQTETSGIVYSFRRCHSLSSFGSMESTKDHSAFQKRGEYQVCWVFMTSICREMWFVVMPAVEKLIIQAYGRPVS